jgi:hypothetical protein
VVRGVGNGVLSSARVLYIHPGVHPSGTRLDRSRISAIITWNSPGMTAYVNGGKTLNNTCGPYYDGHRQFADWPTWNRDRLIASRFDIPEGFPP